ncbi:substrate-binding domain-containing protein [Aphanizomenon flos-aquae]|uniref:substrate-binding domain-containing protein n=1 Tax=Aphanizomenon flos-aquae TaxID=1176 RepID=UPI000489FB90|nr:substrate-binding domain-containing protein [Aphanizomenon flos-aquae]
MWQQQQKNRVIIKLALLMAIVTSPMVANFLISLPIQAESTSETPDFPLPEKVENGTVVKVDSSRNSLLVNQRLKENFETQFSGTKVEIAINGNEDAVKAVLDGKADVASLGRKLTPEEKAQGLKQVLVRQEKIAIIVGMNNPFYDGLTTEQFAKIFRGEITDWLELGNAKGKIRFIDRPFDSDTRNSFSEYSVFKSGQVLTGTNAVQVAKDDTPNIVKELSNDGISYVLASQIAKLPDVRVLKVQDFLPDNSKYPFFQSFVYAYKENPSPKVRDFLGFVLAKPGEESIKAAKEAEAIAIAAISIQTMSLPVANISTTTPSEIPTATVTPSVSQSPSLVTPTPEKLVIPEPQDAGKEIQLIHLFDNPSMITKNMRFLLLMPLLLIAGFSSFLPLWLRRRKRTASSSASLPIEKAQASSNQESDSLPEAMFTLSDSEAFASILNGNGNGANYYKDNDNQEITSVSNIATIDVPQTTYPNNQIQEMSEINLDLNYDEVAWETEDPVIVVNSYFPQIPNIHHQPINADISRNEVSNIPLEAPETPVIKSNQKITSLSELLGITSTPVKSDKSITEVLNLTQAPQPVSQSPQTQDLLSDLPFELGEALNAITSEITFNTPEIEEEIYPTPLPLPATNEAIAMELDAEIEAWTNINPINATGNTRIIFTPRTPKWAYLSWYISEDHQQALHNQGFTMLAIRVYDVTNLDLSYQRPQFDAQYECETAINDRYVPISKGERDYMTEIGYVNRDNQWLCLARSGTVRIFSRPSTDFWVIVDTELVLHGATEAGANVTIDGQKVKVNPDGTFKLTVPFVDNSVDYHITATSANREYRKTIDQKFFQEQKEG